MDIDVGDIILFRGSGPVFHVLSFILGIFEPEWRKRKGKPWHTGVVYRPGYDGWWLIEAVKGGVQIIKHSEKEMNNTWNYHWLDKVPFPAELHEFRRVVVGFPYDGKGYVMTILAYLIAKYTGYHFRIHDQRHYCWETTSLFARMMGKPLQETWDYPLISKILDKLESKV